MHSDNLMPHNVALTPAMRQWLAKTIDETHLSPDEVIESSLEQMASDPEVAAKLLPPGASSLPAIDQSAFKAKLAPVANWRTAGIRLGSRDREGAQTHPWVRSTMGLPIGGSTDIAELWRVGRGHWVINENTRILALFRATCPQGVFVVHEWSQSTNRRRYAIDGYAIKNGLRIDPVTGEQIGLASSKETDIESIIMGHRLIMPPQAANPVVVLRD